MILLSNKTAGAQIFAFLFFSILDIFQETFRPDARFFASNFGPSAVAVGGGQISKRENVAVSLDTARHHHHLGECLGLIFKPQ